MIEALLAGFFGLLIGSFLNVCIHRWPRDLSVVRPRSHCPKCEKPIAWYDNVPVLSYILLRGRCRHCGERISWRYPVVELMTGRAVLQFRLRRARSDAACGEDVRVQRAAGGAAFFGFGGAHPARRTYQRRHGVGSYFLRCLCPCRGPSRNLCCGLLGWTSTESRLR